MSAPAVAVSADGKKFAAAWKDKRVGEPNVYWAVSDTPSFARDALLHGVTKGKQDHPGLALEASGTIWVVWEDSRSGKQRIRARSSGESDKEREVSSESDGTTSFPAVACNAGLVAVVYEAKPAEKDVVVFRLLQPAQP